jgi:hypothetical protein
MDKEIEQAYEALKSAHDALTKAYEDGNILLVTAMEFHHARCAEKYAKLSTELSKVGWKHYSELHGGKHE